MKIIIAGGRDFNDSDFFVDCLEKTKFEIDEIVSGSAKGADKYGELFAREVGIKLTRFPAQWEKYGKSAGPIRNRIMAEYADGLIIFWNGKSRGTFNMIEEMKKLGKPIEEWRY